MTAADLRRKQTKTLRKLASRAKRARHLSLQHQLIASLAESIIQQRKQKCPN